MASIVESSKWEEAVYQLETSDPVVGGPDGIDNLQPRQLANRTRYLKDQQETHAAAANPHPQYAKIDSPALTGTPQTPQAAQFDNTTKVASTSFVQRALGNFANVLVLNGIDAVLDARAFGNAIQFGGTSCIATLPSGNGANAGSAIRFYAQGADGQTFTIKAPAGGFIYAPGAGYGSTNTSITLGTNDAVLLVNRGGAEWDVADGSWIVANEAIAFNGRQSSVTPPQFDSSTRLATTAFVQRALGSYAGFIGIDTTTSLSAAQAGFMIQGFGAVPITATLPAAGDVLIGTCITFFNAGAANLIVASKGDDFIFLGANGQAKTVVMQPRDSLVMLSRGFGEWDLVGGTAALQFSTTLGVSAPQFDSSARLATTDWVNSRGMAPSRMLAYGASQTLTASQAGSIVYLTGAGGFTIKLPLCKSVGSMGGFILENLSTGAVAIAAQGGDGLEFGEESIAPGGSIWVVSDGAGYWHRVFHSNMLNPNFAGQPTASTAPQFDSSKRLATTEFVQRALGSNAGIVALNASTKLTAAQAGQAIQWYGAAGGVLTLPAGSSMANGGALTFVNFGTGPVTVATQGDDFIWCAAKVQPVTLQVGDSLTVVSRGVAEWNVTGGSAALQFAQTRGVTAPQFDNTTKLATTAFVAGAAVGYGQSSYTPVKANRAIGPVYTNTRGRPIHLCVTIQTAVTSGAGCRLLVAGAEISQFYTSNAMAIFGNMQAIVPPGATYQVTNSVGENSISIWQEL